MPAWIPYCGSAPDPADTWARWNFAPELVLVIFAALVGIHLYRTQLRVGPALLAIGVFGFLFVSPFCALGSALFTVRIVHDVILAALLAPFLVATLRLESRRIAGSLGLWTAIHAFTFWIWHAPPLYTAALSSDWVFWAMQIAITGTAAIWWAKVLNAPAPSAVTALLATMVAMGALGALLTFSHGALYAPHWLTTQAWGLSPIEDQQIAGIVMWAPASLVYLLAALTILYRSFDSRVAA